MKLENENKIKVQKSSADCAKFNADNAEAIALGLILAEEPTDRILQGEAEDRNRMARPNKQHRTERQNENIVMTYKYQVVAKRPENQTRISRHGIHKVAGGGEVARETFYYPDVPFCVAEDMMKEHYPSCDIFIKSTPELDAHCQAVAEMMRGC